MKRLRGGLRAVATDGRLPRFVRTVLAGALAAFAASGAKVVAGGEPPSTVPSETDAPYLAELLVAAEAAALHEDPYWHTLLHYERGLFGLHSLIDDPGFFASPEGRDDPAAELRATLRSFFDPDTSQAKHPVCRFVARFEWLREQLEIDETRLPVPRCARFEELFAQIQPEAASLIFPTSHMNSPASMYGHTLLTIGARSETSLLSHAINYSAVTDETFGPLYIAKGLLGLYPGYFSILPYYAKLQEYSDVNDRDIWEYPLDLQGSELRRLMLHLFELENVYSDYYFFSENCSFHLLYLLEAARPSLPLTDEFGWWVIPLDTIRAIKKRGLIRDAIYRPSKSTKIHYLADRLSREGRREAWSIARGSRLPADVLGGTEDREVAIRILDLASEYLQYIYAKNEIDKSDYLPRFLKTLEARSSLGAAGEWRYSIPPPRRPDEGHLSSRIRLGAVHVGEDVLPEISIRPAYHDLLDTETGFKRGSQIIFLETGLRYDPRDEKIRLEYVDAIDIISIAPRDQFFRHVSWKVKTGLFRRVLDNGSDSIVFGLNTGFGWAYEAGRLGFPYLLLETDFHWGGALEDNFALGPGVSVGVLTQVTDAWKIHLSGRGIAYRLGDRDDRFVLVAGQSLGLTTNTNLSLEVERHREHGHYRTETRLAARLFF